MTLIFLNIPQCNRDVRDEVFVRLNLLFLMSLIPTINFDQDTKRNPGRLPASLPGGA
jgi:hypothetical protein